MFFQRSRRYTHVTDEHLPIAPELLGRELAPPWRRAVAIGVDVCLCLLLVLPWTAVWGLSALFLQAPAVFPYAMSLFDRDMADEERETLRDNAWPEFAKLMAHRRPDLLPSEALDALHGDDFETVGEILFEGSHLNFNMGQRTRSHYDRSTNTYHLTGEILFGPATGLFSALSGFLLYFSLFTWRRQGRTPGKWLTAIRVVRLDGEQIRLWDAFGRAGGYSASMSTFGLGFLEVFWNPNRQTIHDRISGTVVVYSPRGARFRRSK